MSARADEIDWIELVTGFSCNCGCEVCPSTYLRDGPVLSFEQMTRAMQLGRARGATGIWFGGGEPTLHPDLLGAVAHARREGYRRIRLQSNGLRLAYADYARALVEAGLDELSVLALGADAETHDACTRLPGSFDLLLQALENATALGLAIAADVLVSTRNLEELPAIVERFAKLGVSRFLFWSVSLHGLDPDRLASWVPSLSKTASGLEAAFERAEERSVEAFTLHVPPCFLAPRYRDRYRHAGLWRLLVVVPGGEPFMAESSPMEGGVYVEACHSCAVRSNCLGLRADYLSLHGRDEVSPILEMPPRGGG